MTVQEDSTCRPCGAGKSRSCSLEERLETLSSTRWVLCEPVGDISQYIGRYGYDVYARENVEAYCSRLASDPPEVVALSPAS